MSENDSSPPTPRPPVENRAAESAPGVPWEALEAPFEPAPLPALPEQAAEEPLPPNPECFVTGHDFSRAANAIESTRALAPEGCSSPIGPESPTFSAACETALEAAPPEPAPLFQAFTRPRIAFPERIPHFGHLCLLALFAVLGLLGASLLTRSALYFHLFGVTTLRQAVNDIRYTLGGQAAFYLLTFGISLVFFPMVWLKGFFAGIAWNGATALRLRGRLFGAAFVCFVLALVNGWLLPGPDNTPIDKILHSPGAPWLLFAFGVTLAPFFEEIAFRGFLLPALATAADWITEKATGQPPPPLDSAGQPQWSLPAMAIASVFTSVPFALMHAEQTGNALGPFLLLCCVSLVLCWTRLATRSLAASVLVHASYNFLLFSLMLLGTGGFQHLDKM